MNADLLPWILGAILIVIAAIATGIALTNTASNSANTHGRVSSKVPTQIPNEAAAIAPTPATPVTTETRPAIPSTAQVGLPPGQVWECVVNGQRAFSDSPCGERPSIRQLNQPNTMDSEMAPLPPAVPYDTPDSGFIPAASYQSAPDFTNDTNVSQEVILIDERKRREHTPRHVDHVHGRPRKE